MGVGVSYISKRYSQSNNKDLKHYDRKQESKHVIYLNANNLYNYVLLKFLRTIGFKWIDAKEFDLNKYSSNISTVFALKVDFAYPKVLLQLHNGYPLNPDKIEIKKEILYVYQLMISNCYDVPIGNVQKLASNLFDKEKYVLYYKLQLQVRIKTKKNRSCNRIL